MKTFLEYLKEEGVLDSIGTGFNQVLNPIRRQLGVKTGELPAGTKEVDYSAIGNKALSTFDTAMSAFGGADPGKKNIDKPKNVSSKIQDRVPQQIPRSPLDKAPERQTSVAFQRQLSRDVAPRPQFGQDTAMKMLKFERKLKADMKSFDDDMKMRKAEFDIKFKAAMEKKQPSKASIGDTGIKKTTTSLVNKSQLAPVENQKASSGGSYKIKAGDNPTKIAKDLGMTLKDLEAKNPGILKRSKRLKIGGTVNR